METLRVYETFVSIQGESSYAGMPCFFIRLATCNLRCRYCDSSSAWTGGRDISIAELVDQAKASAAPVVEITGGEPLLQATVIPLCSTLVQQQDQVLLLETNGSLDIGCLPGQVIRIVDVKVPGSGEGGSFLPANLHHLTCRDEVKFVLTDRVDFEWACAFVQAHHLVRRVHAVYFSPVHGVLSPEQLAKWLVESRMPVRLHLQLHKYAGVR